MANNFKLNMSRLNAAKNIQYRANERSGVLTKRNRQLLTSNQVDDLTMTKSEISSVAGLNYNDLRSFSTVTNDALIAIGQYTKEKKKSKYTDDTAVGTAVYSNLYNNGYLQSFLGDTSSLVKNQTGRQLQNNTVNQALKHTAINKINTSRTTRQGMQDFNEVSQGMNNFKRILEHGGQVVSYDIESLGGTNSRGHQQIDFITEIAAVVQNVAPMGKKGTGVDDKRSMASLLGFSANEYNSIKDQLTKLSNMHPGQMSNKDRDVYIHRLSLLSDPTFKYQQQEANGFEQRVTDSNPDDIVDSLDNAFKGLDVYREIGKKQEEYLNSIGYQGTLEDYKKGYIKDATDLIFNHKHNGTNTELSKNAISIGYNTFNFDDPNMGLMLGTNLEHGYGKGVDLYQAVKQVQEHFGVGAHIPDSLRQNTLDKYGLAQQDQLKQMFRLINKVGAHNAEEDSKALFNIFRKPIDDKGTTYLDFINNQMKAINDKLGMLNNTNLEVNSKQGQAVFLMDKTGQKDWSSNKNGLSFAYNPTDGSIKTHDGFKIDANGNVIKENINGYGPKAGALYTHDYQEIQLDGNWKEQFRNLGLSDEVSERYYQQYSGLDKIYVMRSKEYQDPKALAAKFGENTIFEDPTIYVTLLTNKSQIASASGAFVGRKDAKDNIVWNKDSLKALNLKTVTNDKGKVAIKDLSTEEAGKMLLDRSMVRTSVESAARTIRELPYERAAMLHNYAKEAHQRISTTISQMVLANKTGDMTTSQNLMQQLIEVMGYTNKDTNLKELRPETINKNTVIDKYVESLSPIMNAMEDVFTNTIKLGNSKADKAKKDIIFQNVLTNVLEGMANEQHSMGKNNDTRLLSNGVTSVFTADELNKVDFLRADLFPNIDAHKMGQTVAGENSKYISLDMSKDTGLLNLFYGNQFGDIDNLSDVKDHNAAFTSLLNAYDTIGEDERFKGVWKGLSKKEVLSYQKNKNLHDLNHIMTNKIRSYVNDQRAIEGNSGFGLKYVRTIQDYSNPTNMNKLLSNYTDEQIYNKVAEEMKNSNLDVFMADGTDNKLINNIVDRYFMNFSKDQLHGEIQDLTHTQQSWIKAQYEFSKKEAFNTTQDLLNSIKGTNVTLGILGTGEESRMFLKQGNNIHFLDMQKYVLNNGIINHRIGDVEYATSFAYDVSKVVKRGRRTTLNQHQVLNNINITSNVQQVLNQTRSYTNTVADASSRGEDVIDAIVYRNKSNLRLIREAGAMKQSDNFANSMKRAMYIDTNSIVGILPELREAGIIDSVNKEFYVNADTAKSFDTLIDKIRDGKIRPDRVNDLLANQQNLYFQQYINPLLHILNQEAGFNNSGDVNIKKLIKSLNPHTQDTKLASGIMSVDDNAYAHGLAKFDKTGRSVSIQTENQKLYNTEQLSKDIEKLAEHGLDVTLGGRVNTSAGQKYLRKNGGSTSGLTLKYLSIDSNTLKNQFKDDVKKARNGESNKFSEFLKKAYKDLPVDAQEVSKILAEKAMSLSTYEQQSIMDARVQYAAFYKTNEQIISGRKQLIINHTENIETIKATKNAAKLNFTIDSAGNIKYQLGYEVNRDEVLGMFGQEGNSIRARYTGIFRGRVFDKSGNIISESELTNFVKSSGLVGKTHEEIRAAIDNKYHFKYQLIKKYDDFGHKIANDASEKSTVDTMDLAFGSVDEGLVKEFSKYGLTGLKGQYLSRSYIEHMHDYLISEKHLSSTEANSLINRMLKERFAFSDALQDQFSIFKGVSQTTALESTKHESVSMVAANLMQKISNVAKNQTHERNLHRKLFEGKLSYAEDGTLITDGITKINTKTNDKYLKKILAERDMAVDAQGNEIGHYGYSHVTHLNDWEGGTYAGSGNITSLKNKRDSLEKKIAGIEQSRSRKDGLTDSEKSNLEKLTQQKNAIEHQIGAIANQKGIVFDKRANINLQQSVWNNDSITLARENFADKDEFERYFGHVLNANGKVSSEHLGNSILDPVTSVMRSRTMIGFGETQLSSLKGRERKNYQYLLESYKGMADRISVEKAEKHYSMMQGMRAIDFNSNYTKSRYNALVKGSEHGYNNYKEVDLSKIRPGEDGWLNLDIAGQGHTVVKAENNPYTQNLMIKTGLGGEEEFLAIARMPERHFEDSLIKTSHIRMLNSLQNKLKEINSGTLGDKEAGAIEYAKKLVQDIKKAQVHDVTSKDELAGSLSSSRLAQSFFGKASSITINYDKAFGKNTYQELQDLNGKSFLDKAMFDGKSVLQHYSEGKALDVVAFSEQAADAMGYFNKEFMNKAGARDREHMMDILATKGDTFLATRFPRNQEGSDKVVLGYLDRSLKGNQLKAVGHTGASMKMDHDGDEFGIGRLTNKAGESYLTMDSNSTDEFITSQKAMLMQRAVNDNRYWDSAIRKRVTDVERKIATSGNSIQDVAGKRLIDNQVYSAIMDSSNSSHYETLLQDHNYGSMIKKAMDYDGKGDAHAENIAELKRIHGDNTEAFNNAKNDYVDAFRYQLYKDEFIAKSAKNSIGESNVTNMKLKEAFLGTADRTATDFNYKSALVSNMMYLTEEAAISAKSSIKGLDPNRASIWNTHVRDLVTNKGNADDHIAAMKEWSKEYSIKDLDYNQLWEKSKVFRNVAADTINNGNSLTKTAFNDLMKNEDNVAMMQNRLTNDFVDTLALIRNARNIPEYLSYSSVGQSTVGVKQPIGTPTSLKNFASPTDEMIELQKGAHKDLNDIMKFLSVDDTVQSSRIGAPRLIEKVTANAEELGNDGEPSIGRKILEGAHDLFKEVSGSKIAMGAMGIAAGVMMLGYVGGRPRPADTHAMEEAGTNDYQEQPQGSLMDPGMGQMPMTMGGQQGYVVNINARSNRGKQHAISAIQQAIASGTSSSVNISMNINDNYGNISDRDIQKAIKNAF